MNNKKVFSFHMFLQTLKQTRLAGFIMMAVITLISVVPIISSLSYIKEYEQVNNVGGISGNSTMLHARFDYAPYMVIGKGVEHYFPLLAEGNELVVFEHPQLM